MQSDLIRNCHSNALKKQKEDNSSIKPIEKIRMNQANGAYLRGVSPQNPANPHASPGTATTMNL